jgi:hypothetical protein
VLALKDVQQSPHISFSILLPFLLTCAETPATADKMKLEEVVEEIVNVFLTSGRRKVSFCFWNYLNQEL